MLLLTGKRKDVTGNTLFAGLIKDTAEKLMRQEPVVGPFEVSDLPLFKILASIRFRNDAKGPNWIASVFGIQSLMDKPDAFNPSEDQTAKKIETLSWDSDTSSQINDSLRLRLYTSVFWTANKYFARKGVMQPLSPVLNEYNERVVEPKFERILIDIVEDDAIDAVFKSKKTEAVLWTQKDGYDPNTLASVFMWTGF